MKVKPIRRTLKATALCNPNPSFVSQVKAGANQRPYRAIKMDVAVPVAPEPTPEAKTMKIKQKATANVEAIAPKGFGIMQFEFAKSAFATVETVKAWLDEGGYVDYEIVETTKGFEVNDDPSRYETASARKIEGVKDGVTVFVGKLQPAALAAEAEEAGAEGDQTGTEKSDGVVVEGEGEPAAPAIDPPVRTRSETPAEPEVPAAEPEAAPAVEAERSEGDPVAPVGEEAPEGEVQPVAPTVSDADRAKSMIAEFEAKRTKGVYEASSLGEIVNRLGWIVYDADYSNLSADAVQKIKDAALALLEAFMQVSTDAADELANVFRSAEERDAVTAARSAEPTSTPDLAAVIRSAVSEAVAPLNERLTAAETATTEAIARADKAERALAERVEADNARGQTRKGASEPEPASTENKPEEKRSRAATTLLSAFGSRHAG